MLGALGAMGRDVSGRPRSFIVESAEPGSGHPLIFDNKWNRTKKGPWNVSKEIVVPRAHPGAGGVSPTVALQHK